MKMADAVKKPVEKVEPTLEERVNGLEAFAAVQRSMFSASVATIAYNDPAFGEVLIGQIEQAIKSRYEDDAADIGG